MANKKEKNGKKRGKSEGRPAKKKRVVKADKKPSRKPSKEFLTYEQMKALSKKERVRILAVLCERAASPKEIAEELKLGMGMVRYHVEVLESCGLIVPDQGVPGRGAVENFYRASFPTLVPADFFSHLPSAVRKGISASILRQFIDDASASIEAEVFDEAPGELCWTPLVLDSLGVEEFGQLSRDFLESVVQLQAKANSRLPKGVDKAPDMTSATVFLASFLSARSPGDGEKASATKRR